MSAVVRLTISRSGEALADGKPLQVFAHLRPFGPAAYLSDNLGREERDPRAVAGRSQGVSRCVSLGLATDKLTRSRTAWAASIVDELPREKASRALLPVPNQPRHCTDGNFSLRGRSWRWCLLRRSSVLSLAGDYASFPEGVHRPNRSRARNVMLSSWS